MLISLFMLKVCLLCMCEIGLFTSEPSGEPCIYNAHSATDLEAGQGCKRRSYCEDGPAAGSEAIGRYKKQCSASDSEPNHGKFIVTATSKVRQRRTEFHPGWREAACLLPSVHLV